MIYNKYLALNIIPKNKTPVLNVFYYSYEDNKWTDGKVKLKIEEKNSS
jgi:hypothetical protein